MSNTVLITGGAGFIGSHVAERLVADGWHVTIVDNFDPFYDPSWKRRSIATLAPPDRVRLVEADIRDLALLQSRLSGGYDVIIHLAAKAGVRPSIQNPLEYQDVNVRGTQNLLELAREWGTEQFVFASSSSVYGVSPHVPWHEDEPVNLPISPYAATKVSGELLGRVYSHLFGIRFVGLRFFTVYGPRQRPDLAIHKFARLMLRGEPIPVFGDGTTRRDYTYIDDIVEGVLGATRYTSSDFELFNLGNNRTVGLMELIETLSNVLGVEAKLNRLPEQPGDVPQTWADLSKSSELLGYHPSTRLADGLRAFASWLTQNLEEDAASGRVEVPYSVLDRVRESAISAE